LPGSFFESRETAEVVVRLKAIPHFKRGFDSAVHEPLTGLHEKFLAGRFVQYRRHGGQD
jgi:uncharacterized protein (DUF169 family)